jgi:hypothetical protein
VVSGSHDQARAAREMELADAGILPAVLLTSQPVDVRLI